MHHAMDSGFPYPVLRLRGFRFRCTASVVTTGFAAPLAPTIPNEVREGYAVLEGREIVDAVDLAFLSRYFKR